MEETIFNASGGDNDLSGLQMQDLKAKLLDLKMKNDLLHKENNQLKRENNQLKRPPLFVAVVLDILENGEVYLRQQGNNQEYISNTIDELRDELKPGMKVAVNNTLSIVRTIGNTFDTRVRVMELDESPEVDFKQIGGLRDQIEEVREAVEYPLTKPEIFERIGVEPRANAAAQVVPGLEQGLRDPEPAVQWAAEAALRRLNISSSRAALARWGAPKQSDAKEQPDAEKA